MQNVDYNSMRHAIKLWYKVSIASLIDKHFNSIGLSIDIVDGAQ